VDDATTDLGERARRLELVRPRDLTLRGERGLSRLYRARFEGRPPGVEELGDTMAVTYPRLARRYGAAATITLDASVPWRIEAAGPVRRLTADLGVLTLLGFEDATDRYVVEIRRGARDLTVDTLAAVSAPAGRSGRSLVTVLFTDIVGSTERARELGDSRWREVLDAHDAVARRLVEREDGDLVKTTGDGILAIFEAPGPAIRCAVSLREELRQHGVEIRAGLHTGEVEYRGTDVGGIAVHTAARILAAAAPGEVLVSRTVRDLVAGSGLTLKDRGTHTLRGVGDDWRLYAIAR
jgi:class 3 adenylate cyclase